MSERAYSEQYRLARIRRYAIEEDQRERRAARADRDADRYQIVDDWLADEPAPVASENEPRHEAKY